MSGHIEGTTCRLIKTQRTSDQLILIPRILTDNRHGTTPKNTSTEMNQRQKTTKKNRNLKQKQQKDYDNKKDTLEKEG